MYSPRRFDLQGSSLASHESNALIDLSLTVRSSRTLLLIPDFGPLRYEIIRVVPTGPSRRRLSVGGHGRSCDFGALSLAQDFRALIAVFHLWITPLYSNKSTESAQMGRGEICRRTLAPAKLP